MTPVELRRGLSEGLSSWLMFEHHAGHDELFSERYLALPIGQLLQYLVKGKVTAESNHPVLTTTGKAGRPPQIDFIVHDEGKVVLVLESKWAAKSKVSIVDVLWDIVRLELAADRYGCEALFVLAGTRNQVDAVLKSSSFSVKSSRNLPTQILHLHGSGKLSIKIGSFENGYSVPLHARFRKYPSVKWPAEINCSHGTQLPKVVLADAYTAAVWHIQPAGDKKRRPFTVMSESETKRARKAFLAKVRAKAAGKKVAAKRPAAKSRR